MWRFRLAKNALHDVGLSPRRLVTVTPLGSNYHLDFFLFLKVSWLTETETHLAVLDPEKKSLNGLFSLLNIRHPKKVCSPFSQDGQVRRMVSWNLKIGAFRSGDFSHPNLREYGPVDAREKTVKTQQKMDP